MTNSARIKESTERTFSILAQVGEELPRPHSDELKNGISAMNRTLENMSDDSILNMEAANDADTGIVLKLYSRLLISLNFDASLKAAISLRMVDLTMQSGLSSTSPIAFASYGGLLMNIGSITEGCRLGACIFIRAIEPCI